MSHTILIPHDLWEEADDAVITAWLSSDGDVVEAGQVVAEIMVQKIQHDILSPAAGRLRILKETDEVVAKGEQIAELEDAS